VAAEAEEAIMKEGLVVIGKQMVMKAHQQIFISKSWKCYTSGNFIFLSSATSDAVQVCEAD